MTWASLALLLSIPLSLSAQPAAYSFDDAQRFLQSNCQACHQGASPAGNFAVRDLAAPETLRTQSDRWNKLALRVRQGEMPPKAAPAPPLADRDRFVAWSDS